MALNKTNIHQNFIGLFLLIVVFACNSTNNHKEISAFKLDSLKCKNTLLSQHSLENSSDSFEIIRQRLMPKLILKFKDFKFIPIYDKRHLIIGTFSDSSKIDTLKESYISTLTNRETCNSYDISNYKSPEVTTTVEESIESDFIMDTLIALIAKAKPRLILKSSNPKIKPLFLNKAGEDYVTGIAYLINVGDVNSDNKDDIAVVNSTIRYAGATSTCKIFSYKSDKWKELLSFIIYEIPYEMKNATRKIPGFLEKKNGKWYYHDYNWQGLDSERRLLKIK
jgi:hypothetical protein